jgi:beta-glucosidase-like glycosyl hydrolase/CubicO group peptidase (beta-lactamase class C family)
VERTLSSLSLREKAAQLVTVWLTGGYASTSSPEFEELAELVEVQGIGGLVISIGLPHGFAAKLNSLQARATVPLLVSSDLESGPGYRLGGVYALPTLIDMGGATEFPPAMAFGAIDEEETVFEMGRITALEARALGVHLNFAPVLDVNSNPTNPIINTRSFGEDPERVAALGAAMIRGMHAGGLMATGKHFPGHGDTSTDSHVELPIVEADRLRLDSLELVPFRRAIQAGVDAVMTAHVAVPGILGPGAPPATLSADVMTGLLRDELGFQGLLYTDALDMGAIVRGYGDAEAAVRAVQAGADVVLMPLEPVAAIEAIVAAVDSGRLSETRLDSSVRRLLESKARAGLHRGWRVDPERIPEIVGSAEHVAFAETVAARSITIPRDLEGRIPVDSSRVGRVFSLTFSRQPDQAAGRAFDARLLEAGIAVQSARADFMTPEAVFDSLAEAATAADLVLLSAYVPPRSGVGSVDVSPAVGRFADRVRTGGTPLVLLSFGSPYLLSSVPDAATYLLAWGGRNGSQRAAAEALLGVHPVAGRLPISLPPFHDPGDGLTRPIRVLPEMTGAPGGDAAAGPESDPRDVGMDPAGLERIDRLLRVAIHDSVTPGAALAIGRGGQLVRLRGYGRLDWSGSSSPVTDSTIYDLASLTKVVSTTTAVMQLVAQGTLGLTDPVGKYLPEWGTGWKRDVTIRQLLLHRGGLPPFRPFWRDLEGRAAYREAIAALEPMTMPGDSTVYSDLGFITLGFVVEEVSGRSLDNYLRHSLTGPLALTDTGYRPDMADRARTAPTEVDSVYRMEHLRGVVHDENAHAMGGVAGHAGLFSSARDLAVFAHWLLDAVRAPSSAGGEVSGAGAAQFTARHDPSASRALGWDTPTRGNSAGRYLSARAFGHTGFTGTSLWIDPELDLFVVLLTNRVNPTRDNRAHIPLRRAVHEAVAQAIRDRSVRRRE